MLPIHAAFPGFSNEDIKTIGAAATTVGVLVALFGGGLKRWWRAPLLDVAYEASPPEPHWDHVSIPDKSFFLRIRVRNARGCDAARNVEVIVTAFRSGAIGLDERSLEWSGQRSSRSSPVTRLDVPPGLSRHIDIVQIGPRDRQEPHDPQDPSTEQLDEARLCVFPKPVGESHIFGPGQHKLELVVTAANADAVTYSTAISYPGGRTALLVSEPEATNRPLRDRLRAPIKRR